jgi:selenocysteine lyase/cysteine desulfurase
MTEHSSGTVPWQYWQEPKGVRLVRPVLPILPSDPGEIVEVLGRNAREIAAALFERHRIDSRPMMSHGLNGLRISLAVFNSEDEVELLVRGLSELAG